MLEWKTKLKNELCKIYGETEGNKLYKKYQNAFSAGYIETFQIETAVIDIQHIEKLSPEEILRLRFYKDADNLIHLRIYQWPPQIILSDFLPMLENFDLRTREEHPFKITLDKKQIVWIKDFSLQYKEEKFQFKKVQKLFETAFTAVYFGIAENDGFNKLVTGSGLSWHEVIILRLYAKYLQQIRFHYSQMYIEQALINNAAVSRELIKLFYALHDPKNKNKPEPIEKRILKSLELIPDLDEDTVIRRILELIKATLRTNYFQLTKEKTPKNYVSIKLNSQMITDIPLPKPLYDTFVYSDRFEGIHLRNTKIARGGIRWSDRLQDYRTEALGLMKAQVVKNSVIVPSGSKGCFVLKKINNLTPPNEIKNELINCYTLFIKGLLDLVDNVKNEKYIPPKNVVCYDEPDPYLVVAADKGTASFSDLANSISLEYDFWLKDAFASGGSEGYDHKKMGITARGAWESIKRHFRELEVNISAQPITVVGIGDMSGDVFGNGMLYSKNIKLIGAFDHRHIFLDPNPSLEKSYNERLRLFKLPNSSWEDYKGISKGGGVFKKSLKTIPISKEMKKVLDITADSLSPNQLISALLCAPVELLYNGGIGTYVKGSQEANIDVGDKSNDYCRVNGADLRCKIVGEGGNLGFTQLGRIEYSLTGGLIYTDFIDNSAGVNCSDHEVNLKILLNKEMQQNKLTYQKRNKLLSSLTDEIADLVLEDNYHQALALSFAAYSAKQLISLHIEYIKMLEGKKLLNRKVEYLPIEKELLERKVAGLGLTRPELAVLLAYTKIHLKQEILNSTLPEDPSLQELLETAFAPSIRKKYKKEMYKHQLKRYIVATQLANDVVNTTGITFIYQMHKETGASIEDIIKCYYIVIKIFETNDLQQVVQDLDFKVMAHEQFDIISNLHKLVKLSIRWFLQKNTLTDDLSTIINQYKNKIDILEKVIPDLMGGVTKQYLTTLIDQFQRSGLSKAVATRIATYRAIYASLNIIQVSNKCKSDLVKTAEIYFASGEKMNLLWFRDYIANDNQEGQWNTLARLSLRNELDTAQRNLTYSILKTTPNNANSNKRIDLWMTYNHKILERWENLLTRLHDTSNKNYTMFFIVIREFIRMLEKLTK